MEVVGLDFSYVSREEEKIAIFANETIGQYP